MALCWVTTPDAAGWGPPLRHHVGDPVPSPASRDRSRGPRRFPPATLSKIAFAAFPEIVRTVPHVPEPTWQGLLTVRRLSLPGALNPLRPLGGRPKTPFGNGAPAPRGQRWHRLRTTGRAGHPPPVPLANGAGFMGDPPEQGQSPDAGRSARRGTNLIIPWTRALWEDQFCTFLCVSLHAAARLPKP